MRALVPAALLPGHEPHRGGLLQGEGDLEKSPSPNPRNAHRSHGTGAGVGEPFGRPRLLRTPRVPCCYGSTVLASALGFRFQATGIRSWSLLKGYCANSTSN